MKQSQPSVYLVVACIVGLALLVPQPVSAKISVDGFGNLVAEVVGQVLGVKTTNSPGKSDQAQAQAAAAKEERELERYIQELNVEKKQARVTIKKITVSPKENRVRVTTENQEGLVISDVFEATDSADIVVDPEDNSLETDEVEVSPPADENVISLRAKNNAAYVIRNKVAAKSKFPLQVNLNTNELIVTTPKGAKIVTVLPDAAVRNMLAANVLDQAGGKGGLLWLAEQERLRQATMAGELEEEGESTESGEIPEATDSAEPTVSVTPEPESTDSAVVTSPTPAPEVTDVATTVVEMEETEDGVLTYKIEGFKTKKLLGFRKVTLPRIVYVSAETGEIVSIEQDWMSQLIDWLSTD